MWRLQRSTGPACRALGAAVRRDAVALAARGLAEATDAARRDARLTHADPTTGAASAALRAARE